MTEKRILSLILALFVLLGISYAVLTPVFEASDELWHYPMVQHLANGNPLPVQVFDPNEAGPWKQEASQPPLYYYLSAALTFWIDTSDMEEVRWLNPHVDNGIITVDGNVNLAIHDPAFNPWQGTLLAVRIVRIFSVLLGACTVYLTYLIAKEALPQRPDVALGAAAVNAFTPMFLFISGAVNNDNLAIPLSSLGVLLLIRAVTRSVVGGRYALISGATARRSPLTVYRLPFTGYVLLVGTVIGLAVLTKQGAFALLPLAWGTLFIARWQAAQHGYPPTTGPRITGDGPRTTFWSRLLRAFAESLLYFALLLIPVILIAGWWYWRNIQLYGDFLGWNAFIAVLGARAQPASLAQLWDERWGFMLAYWGLFGGVNVPMATWIYHVLNGAVIAGVCGFGVYLVQELRSWLPATDLRGPKLEAITVALLALVQRYFALVVCLLFAGAVVFGLVQWATTTWSSQGRLVFTALSALCVLLVVGLVGWLPRRQGQWVAGGLAGFMFVIAALAPWLWIRPVYQAQAYAPPGEYEMSRSYTGFGRARSVTRVTQMQLMQKAVVPQRADGKLFPGDYVDVVLDWNVMAPMERDWSIFVHLNDPVLGGVPIAQRDMYPGQGLRPTSLLQEGESLTTFFRLQVPETAVAPAELELTIGFYELQTWERMSMELEMDHVVLKRLQLVPKPGDYPNPTAVNFMNEFELVGYEMSDRRLEPGAGLTLKLYVRAQRPLTRDYSFSAQVVRLDDTTRWGSNDRMLPTTTWEPGDVQTVELPLVLAEDTPADVYPLILRIYSFNEDGGLQNLQLVTENGRITQDDLLQLTKILVENR